MLHFIARHMVLYDNISVLQHLRSSPHPGHILVIDPDDQTPEMAAKRSIACVLAGTRCILVGGSTAVDKILKRLKVDYVLIPSIKEIYKKKSQMKIKLKKNDKILCAKYRPGHFEGVLGVISIFLKSIKAKLMFLGDKDFQQVYIIRKYLEKKFKTKIINCKTIRLKNCFPYSSRNKLLSKKKINNGISISNLLKRYHKNISKEFSKIKEIESIYDRISKKCSRIEYFEIRNKNNLSKNINKKNFKIFIAYYFGKVRLIDNF